MTFDTSPTTIIGYSKIAVILCAAVVYFFFNWPLDKTLAGVTALQVLLSGIGFKLAQDSVEKK